MTNLINGYSNYVNSFYSNDVEMLKKRQKQAKAGAVAAATVGTTAAVLGLLPKNKIKIPCFALAAFSLLTAFNMHNYTKMTDKKIVALNTKV